MDTNDVIDRDAIAHEIAAHGIGSRRHTARLVVAAARRLGLDTTAVAILDDESAPTVARERALGIVLEQLDRIPATTRVASDECCRPAA